MPRNISTLSALEAWASQKGLNFSSEDKAPGQTLNQKEILLLTLCAEVSPDKDATTLLKSLRDALSRAKSENLESFPPLTALVTDPRLPAWTRLAAALSLGFVDVARILARHAPALTEHASKARVFLDVIPEAFNVLSTTNRFLLVSSSMITNRDFSFTSDEVIEVLQETKATAWSPEVRKIRELTIWGDNFAQAYSKLETISELARFSAEDTFALAAKIFKSTKCADESVELLRPALDSLAGLLGKIKKDNWPRKVEELEHKHAASVLLRPSASQESNYRHLAGICAHAYHSYGRSEIGTELLLELTHPDSVWALPEIAKNESGAVLLTILERLLKEPKLYKETITEMVADFSNSRTEDWINQPNAEMLFEQLYALGWNLLRSARYEIEYRDSFKIPVWAIEAFIDRSGNFNPDSAQAGLIRSSYIPLSKSPLSLSECPKTIEALAWKLLKRELGEGTPGDYTVAAAWIQKMNVHQVSQLIQRGLELRCERYLPADIPTAITSVIEEALRACTSEQAKNIVLSTLANPNSFGRNRATLLTFAKEISTTVEKTLV